MSYKKTALFILILSFINCLFAQPHRAQVAPQINAVNNAQLHELKQRMHKLKKTLQQANNNIETRKKYDATKAWIAEQVKIHKKRTKKTAAAQQADQRKRQEQQDHAFALQLQAQEEQLQRRPAQIVPIRRAPEQRTAPQPIIQQRPTPQPAVQQRAITIPNNPETETKVEKLPNGTLLIPEDFACLFCHKTFADERQAAHFDCHIKDRPINNFFNFLRCKKPQQNLETNTHLYHVECIEKWKKHPAYGIDGIHQCIAGCQRCASNRIIIPIQLKPVARQQNNQSIVPSCCIICSKNFTRNEQLCCAKLHPDCDKNHSVHKACMDKWRASAFGLMPRNGDDLKMQRGPCFPARGASCPYGCLDPLKTWLEKKSFPSQLLNLFLMGHPIHTLKKTDKPYQTFTAQQTTAAVIERRLTIPEAARARAQRFNPAQEQKVCFTCTENSDDKQGRWVNIRCNSGHTTTYCEDCWNYVERADDGDLRTCKIRTANQNCGTSYTQGLLDAATWQTNE